VKPSGLWEMGDADSFELLLVGFRNDLARSRALNFLRERAHRDGIPVPLSDLSLPYTLLARADFDTAQCLSAELTQLGALVRLTRLEKQAAPAPSVEAVSGNPTQTPRAGNRVLHGLFMVEMSLVRVVLALVFVGVVSATFLILFAKPFVVIVRPAFQTAGRAADQASRASAPTPVLSMGKRAEIDQLVSQKNFPAAIARLSESGAYPPGNPEVRAALQKVYEKWAVSEIDGGRLDGALTVMQHALDVQETPSIFVLQGGVYLKKGNWDAARRAYEKALDLGNKDGKVCLALVSIYRQLGDQKTALAMLDRAREYGAKGPEFDTMVGVVTREQDAESGFQALTSAHFRVSFAQGEDPTVARFILAELERAYQIVGQKLGYYPDHVTPVALYEAEDFQRVTQSPDWAGALYDGRIKVPVRGLESNDSRLSGILRHEYSHVLNLLIAGENCPVWLNEGVAMWVQDEREGDYDETASAVVKLSQPFKLTQLEKSFARLSPEQAAIAYAQGYLAVRYIVRRYGELALHRLLAAFAQTSVTQDVFRETLGLELSTLEQDLRFQ
jgi:tetratricopeptide (TPR) repeat protein